MNFLQVLLWPLSLLYNLATRLRNYLYDIGRRTEFTFDIPVISVGNLAVGGTGKTPAVEYLIRLLLSDHQIVTLSRGYGRRTRGFRIATESDSAATIGDEPYQFYTKFPEIHVSVGEERAVAIPHILSHLPDTSVILLDDAFQHRAVKPQLSIMLTTYSRPFYKDHVMPSGRLREARSGASRADAIVVTKCPERIASAKMSDITSQINAYAPGIPVFFTNVKYARENPVIQPLQPVILVSGIANASDLVDYVAASYQLVHHMEYSDHHRYTSNDISKIVKHAKEHEAVVLTTEKDFTRLRDFNLEGVSLHFLPIEMNFLKDGVKFDGLVRKVFSMHL